MCVAVTVRVGEVPPESYPDKGTVRLDPAVLEDLDCRKGECISIEGENRTVAKVSVASPADDGLGIVRMPERIRKNAGAGLGQEVDIKANRAVECEGVTLVVEDDEDGTDFDSMSGAKDFSDRLEDVFVSEGDILDSSYIKSDRHGTSKFLVSEPIEPEFSVSSGLQAAYKITGETQVAFETGDFQQNEDTKRSIAKDIPDSSIIYLAERPDTEDLTPTRDPKQILKLANAHNREVYCYESEHENVWVFYDVYCVEELHSK